MIGFPVLTSLLQELSIAQLLLHCCMTATSSPPQVAVCNLASIALPMFVGADQTFDFQRLLEVTKVVTRNLNKIIDLNCYPIPEAQASNFKHRPIGIGVQVWWLVP